MRNSKERQVSESAHDNCSDIPVVSAAYVVHIYMNEEHYRRTNKEHIKAMEREIQRVFDDADFTESLRYNACTFEVVSRTVFSEAEPNG